MAPTVGVMDGLFVGVALGACAKIISVGTTVGEVEAVNNAWNEPVGSTVGLADGDASMASSIIGEGDASFTGKNDFVGDMDNFGVGDNLFIGALVIMGEGVTKAWFEELFFPIKDNTKTMIITVNAVIIGKIILE